METETDTTLPTLLIVDDEERPRASVKIIFQDHYNILLAGDGESALKLLRENRVDVAILDILMAGMSGTELLGKIKEYDPTIEVIMLTAYETLQTARLALRYGACDYLNKPFDVSTIRAAVRNACKKRRNSIARQSAYSELQKIRHELHEQALRQEMERTKGEIYANILHDINNPLTVITLYIDSLGRSLEDSENLQGSQLQTIRHEMDAIRGQITHCFEISRRYLSYLRHKEGEIHYASVNQTMKDIDALLRAHPALHDHALTITPLPVDIYAAIHSIDLLQILLNLTTNALQCTTQTHRVEIDAEYPVVLPDSFVTGNDSGNRFFAGGDLASLPELVAIRVRDDGPGIDVNTFEKIFEMPVTTKGAGDGTGLGLTIVKRLVKAAGGAVHVHTEAGTGTAFTVYLPKYC